MKKKLNLNDLKVQSFVTSADQPVLGGQQSLPKQVCVDPNTYMTDFSCYQYISCNPTACYIRTQEDHCSRIGACIDTNVRVSDICP